MNLALEFGSFRTNFSGTVAKCSLNASANSIGSFTEFPSTSKEVEPEGLKYIIYLSNCRVEKLALNLFLGSCMFNICIVIRNSTLFFCYYFLIEEDKINVLFLCYFKSRRCRTITKPFLMDFRIRCQILVTDPEPVITDTEQVGLNFIIYLSNCREDRASASGLVDYGV